MLCEFPQHEMTSKWHNLAKHLNKVPLTQSTPACSCDLSLILGTLLPPFSWISHRLTRGRWILVQHRSMPSSIGASRSIKCRQDLDILKTQLPTHQLQVLLKHVYFPYLAQMDEKCQYITTFRIEQCSTDQLLHSSLNREVLLKVLLITRQYSSRSSCSMSENIHATSQINHVSTEKKIISWVFNYMHN